MAKRPNPRAVKAVRTCTVPEAAQTLGVTVGTVRSWIKHGMRAMTMQRPHLILGKDVREYLAHKSTKGKVRLAADQLYCLTCKAPQCPYGMMLDFTSISTITGRLSGLCETCGGTCNRMVSQANLPYLATIFDIAYRENQ